jgi:hypothetical protein
MLSLLLSCPNTHAQNTMVFGPTTKFGIPAYGGTIGFAVNGTYSNASFQNDSWTFRDLRLEGSQPLDNLIISAQNCNITIVSYQIPNLNSFRNAIFRYTVNGNGKQVLNLGFGPEPGGSSSGIEWSVIFNNNVFAAQGDQWNVSHDGTINVDRANGTIRVIHWGFLSQIAQNSNLPFYEQHSVAIIVIVSVAATIMVAVVINLNIRRREDALGESN